MLRLLAWLVRQNALPFGLAGLSKGYVFWLGWFAKMLRLLA